MSEFNFRHESDPRLQLYNVASDCLQRLELEFLQSPLAEKYEWIGYFHQKENLVQTFDFRDPNSTLSADSASCGGIFTDVGHELKLPLELFQDGSPYSREKDLDMSYELFGSGGFYDVILAPEIPPTIIPSGVYDAADHTLNDLYNLVNDGTGEMLSSERCRQLIKIVGTFSIDQLDATSLTMIPKSI